MGWRFAIAHWIRKTAHRLAHQIAGTELPDGPARDELFLALFDGLESLAEGFIVCDPEGRVIYFNEQYLRLFPLLADVVKVGVPLSDLLDVGIERGMFAAKFNGDFRQARLNAFEGRDEKAFFQKLSDGRTIQTRDQRTKSGGYVGIRSDVTEVQHGRDMMQSLIDNIPELVTLKDQQGRYFFVNKCFEDWTDTDRDSVIGKTVFDVYDEAEARAYEERDRRIAETLKPELDEVEIRFPDGGMRTVILIAFPVLNEDGMFGGSGVICIDITERKKAEKVLSDKEALLRAAMDNMTNGLMLVDEHLCVKTINQQMIQQYDLPKYLAKPGTEVRELVEFRARRGDYGAGSPERRTEERLTIWKSKRAHHFEDRVPGGRILDVHLKALEDGAMLAVSNEITEAKKAEQSLISQSLLLQLTRNAARIANEAYSLEEALEKSLALICHFMEWPVGHVYRINAEDPALLEPSGIWYASDQVRFARLMQATSEIRYRLGRGLPGRVLENGQPVWLPDIHRDQDIPKEMLDSAPEIRTGCGMPIRIGNRIVAVMELYSDRHVDRDQNLIDSLSHISDQIGHVAEREENAKVSRNNAKLFQLVMEYMTGGIFMFDRDLKIVLSSPKFAEIYDIPSEMMTPGKSAIDVMRYRAERGDYGPGDVETLLKRRVQGYYSSQPYKVIEDHLPDGGVIELFRTRTDKGDTIAVFHDVTDRKATEKQMEKQRDELERLNQQKNKFFSIIAHDLKDPFGTVLGYLDLMRLQAEKGEFDKLTDYTNRALQAGNKVHDLLENLLEWSWLQMDRVEFNPEVMDIEPVLERNISLFKSVAEAKKIELIGDFSTLEKVFADAKMIDTVIRNLINNAIKFTNPGGMVTAGVWRDGDQVEVFVRDTGVGIPENRLETLFTAEEKMSSTGTSGELGTGLGLILCKELMENNSGTISVESTEDEGSIFRIRLPVSKKELAATAD